MPLLIATVAGERIIYGARCPMCGLTQVKPRQTGSVPVVLYCPEHPVVVQEVCWIADG